MASQAMNVTTPKEVTSPASPGASRDSRARTVVSYYARRAARHAIGVRLQASAVTSRPPSAPHELQRSLNPGVQLVVVLDVLQGDQHPSSHRAPARILELADVGVLQCLVALLRADPDEQ